MKQLQRVFVICNAMDDELRRKRGITTDSPAASRKVFMLCQASRVAGIRPLVFSLGRGRTDGSGRHFDAAVRRVTGVPVLYAPFSHRPVLSQLLSLFAPSLLLWRARKLAGEKTVVFYNRLPAYIPALVTARLLGLRTVLDLEDGPPVKSHRLARWTHRLFDGFCNGGALLACSALAQATHLRPVACYYGAVAFEKRNVHWPARGLSVLMGGTVSADTGARVLIDAVEHVRRQQAPWADGMEIVVTGRGDGVEALQRLAQGPGWPRVTVHGRLRDDEYRAILAAAQVGLALKPRTGPLADTTFPSKVVELAGAGLLVVSTDISDVRQVLKGGALYVGDETGPGLAERLQWIVEHREAAQAVARLGLEEVRMACDLRIAGRSLAQFLFRTP
jgi:glycosyltransferase involved in cell wall biosynthesis